MAKRKKPDPCPVEAYARDITSGKIAAGHLVRLACERHLRDVKDGDRRGLSFDRAAAQHAIDFFAFLHLAEGQFDGQPFILQPFQAFIVGSLYGWKNGDGFRRFRTAYIEQGKGNGKSPLAGGIGLLGLVADDEPGAEIYSAATAREQAGILFRDAKNMAGASPALSKILEIGEHNIAHFPSRSFFRPVSSEHRGLDGKRVHVALIDELHEHPTALVVDKMRAGTKGRRQALIFEITNSGYDKESVCWHHHEYSEKVLKGIAQDDSWFAYVCQLDEGDDWRDEKVWLKANPNLGVSVTEKYLREQVREAVGMPSKQNIVKRLNFCVWTEQASRWLDIERWDACALPPFTAADLAGEECYAGLDLASTTDLAALVLLFPQASESQQTYAVLPYYWVPETACKDRERRNKTLLDKWIADGLIERTPGDVIDYDRIRAKVNDLGQRFRIKEIAIDRWNATQLTTQLQGDGFTMVPFGQGFASMAAPTKELETLILSRRLRHAGHEVLRWNAGNAAIEQDAAGNAKPSKGKATEKIDGIVALIMALGRATLAKESAEPGVEFI